MYGEAGELIGFEYNNVPYYYLKNNQNDIIGIIDANKNVLAKYTYDSWGKIISIKDNNNTEITSNTHIANINPFRYRSYYYDLETKLYYLNSRYYNPEWGRFINADGTIGADKDILSYNLYIYVCNNPINNVDFSGAWSFKNIGKNIKNAINKVASKATQVQKAISKTINKVKNKVKKVVKAVKNAFVLDAGIGLGMESSNTGFGGGYYNDRTIKISNGEVKTGSTISVGVKYKNTSGKSDMIGKEFFHKEHYVEGDLDASIDHTQYFPLISTISNCDQSEDSFSIGREENNLDIDASKNDIFIGLNLSTHVGVGGHIKIGFVVPWFIN